MPKNSLKPSNPYNSEPENTEKRPKLPMMYYVAVILLLIGVQLAFFWSGSTREIPYSSFRTFVVENKVESVKIAPEKLYVTLKPGVDSGLPVVEEKNEPTRQFLPTGKKNPNEVEVNPVRDEGLTALLEEHGVTYEGTPGTTWIGELIQWILPFALLLGLYFFIFRRMGGAGGPGAQFMNISKNKAALYENLDEHTRITFTDVAGLDEAKAEVMEVVDFLKDPKKYTRLGGKLPKGVLLVGPPGTGKTLLAKAVAGEADVPFFSISGSDFVEMFVGVGAARVRDLFKQAKEKAPCIIFIDEIDAVGRSRGKGAMMGGNDERENTLNQLLVEMDGFATDKGVILMAATNRPDVLDPALLRPGRFDRQIMVDKPDLKGRMDTFRVHTNKLSLSPDVNLKALASQTPGFAGAEIANAANEAALLASRRNKESIEMKDFEDAIERVVAGLEKKNKVINPKEKRIVAYHEAGHAIVSWMMAENDPVQKISIVPRGMSALGYTMNIPLEDRYLMTKKELWARICGLLGGRLAEEAVFGEISTGAQNDLEKITGIAYNMVTVYGMSEKLGNLSFYESNNPYYGAPGMEKKYGEETAHLIDQEVKEIVGSAAASVRALLEENRDKLERLAGELLAKEMLQYCQIEEILGKRPGGGNSEHEVDCSEKPEEEKPEIPAADSNGKDPEISEEELLELQAAAERLKESRNASEN
ncbi:ATP-dependent metallopeptidase FtsH/Yme1/Tma family protein [Chlorobium phaeovibrioides]|uniref:ATP-dependent zinc metalloprotease FtsH n=1 Tax=Chlorobium phaeovibrioides TaxID=1094 RepID=A0A432AUC7_CHLPH|nr:ATP-dependent zinc metalloprotease FtsH [Chlorobium phaeovibrioides]MWV54169.1 ATP-dependent zinc metalloprotease FtsH [Chlorobium phaeovibrioides]QEQ57626.1 ATP-dependent zinc metalloprotease FtsH [Chlorobium phaeovibrioides]RTY34627.1 ATP-dependent metallopeptidase FtsH/Yme1/Tma family protein [Chlorobium phaeovibrioides]RTY37729.1 ATP-dependent metallopeptidase FtsH/Yme1/Tma family protein [Chlorobium phaeovibrioides]